MAVITAIKLYDAITAGESASQSNRAQRGFRSRIHEADFFYRWNQLRNQLCNFDFPLGWRSKRCSNLESLTYCSNDFRWAMTQNQRAPGADVVNVFPTIHIPDVR